MADINQIDFGDGTARDLRDTSAIKWGQAKKYVGKNKLNHTFTSRTDVLTFVVNGDKTIDYSGSTSSSWLMIFIKEHMTFADGDYIISGSDSANGYVSIYDEASPSTALAFSLNGSEGTFTADSSKQYKVSISFKPNLSNISGKFSPMIRPASASDNTYESYIPDNTELADSVDGITAGEIVPATYDTTQNLISSAISSLYASGKIKIGCPYISSVLKTGSSRWGMIVIGLTSTECTGLLWKYTDLFTFNYINGSVSVKKATLSDL